MRFVAVVVVSFVALLSLRCADSSSATEPTETDAPPSETYFSLLLAPELTMRVGDTMQVRAVATLHDQTRQIVTAAAAWRSSNTAVATVDPSGVVTALGNGTSQITATLDSIEATSSLTVSADQRSGTEYFGGVAAPEAEAGSMVIVFGETARVTGTLRIGSNLIELIGRLDAPTGIVNVAGGGFTFLGTLAGSVLSGSYQGPAESAGGFAALDTTHVATTAFCGTYTSDGKTTLGNEDSGTFVLLVSLDGTVAATSLAADGSGAPRNFAGRRDGSSLELATNRGATASGVLENGAVTGSIRDAATTATFTATPATCP